MYKINWENPAKVSKNGVIIDVGDIRLLLKERPHCWELNIGIRVYNNDLTKSMVRPPVNITQFNKPCSFDDAKIFTEKYINNFLLSITNDLI